MYLRDSIAAPGETLSRNVTQRGERPVACNAIATPGTAIAVEDLVDLVRGGAHAGLDVEVDIAGVSSGVA